MLTFDKVLVKDEDRARISVRRCSLLWDETAAIVAVLMQAR